MKLTRRGIFGVIAAAVLGRNAVAALEPCTASGAWLDSLVSGASDSNAPSDWAANNAMWAMKTPAEIMADIQIAVEHEKYLQENPAAAFEIVWPQRVPVGCYTGDDSYYALDGNRSRIF